MRVRSKAAGARSKKQVRLDKPIVLGKSRTGAEIERLAASEEKYRALVEMAYEGITIADPEDTLTFLNKRFAKSLGYRVSDLIGKSLLDLATEESARAMQEATKRRMKGQRSRYEVTLCHKDGSLRHFMLSVSPIFTKGHTFKGTMGVYTDITKRKTAEEALKFSEKRFRMMIDQSHMGFVVTDGMRLVFANDRLAKMAGFKSGHQMKGLNLLKLLTPESYRKAVRNLERHFTGKPVPAVDEYSFLKKGKKVYLRTFTKNVMVDGKEMSQTFVLDITERKLMERKLQKRVKQIQALYKVYSHARVARNFSDVLNGIVEDIVSAFPESKHAQGRIVFDDKVYSSPRKLKPFHHKIEVPLMVAGVQRGVLEAGCSAKVEDSENSRFLRDEKELAENVAKILSKHMYAREVVGRYREIVNKAFTAIIIVQQGVIQYVNPRFYTLFKCRKTEVIGKPISRFLVNCKVSTRKADGRVRECVGMRPRGTDVEIAVTMLKTTYHGEDAILVRANDITALKRAQRKLKSFNSELKKQVQEKTKHLEAANKRLMSLNELKDEFIAITSHELRSPLTSIRGYLSFLVEDESIEQIPEPYREYLIRAYNTTDSLNYLINNILDVSRLDMGRFELQIQEVDIVSLVKGIVDSLYFQAGEKRLNLEFRNETGAPKLPVSIDSIRVSQVLRNILDNSIKFTKRGKTIRVILKLKGDKLVLQIVDQGVGIPKAKLNQIFDKFMQVKNIQTKYRGGVGLGLFIAKRIIQLHHGKIEAKQNADKGTTISIELPIHDKGK